MFWILYFLILIILISFSYGSIRGAPWFSAGKTELSRFLKLVDIQPGDKMCDLGCGDGRFVFASSKAGAKAWGFEVSLSPFFIAKIKKVLSGQKNCRIVYKDFWFQNLGEFDIIYFFLSPKVSLKMKKKIEKECREGTKIVACTWPLEGWTPVQESRVDKRKNLFLYEV
jgi:SAM-dependent methyltransferase